MLLKALFLSLTIAVALAVMTSMLAPGAAPAQARSAVVTAAASRIPVPHREVGVTTRIAVPPRLPDAMETPTLGAAPVLAAMVMAKAVTTAPNPPEVTAPTTMADAMVAGDFMRLRSADHTAPPTQRAFIVVLGKRRRKQMHSYRRDCMIVARYEVPGICLETVSSRRDGRRCLRIREDISPLIFPAILSAIARG
jgi:hypothetical protein